MAKPPPEPLGADYWKKLTPDQQYLCAALKAKYVPLRHIVEQNSKDTARKVTGHVRWEKLLIWGLLDLDTSRRDNVYVRRGPKWSRWWDLYGVNITGTQSLFQEDIDLDERLIIRAPENSN